MAKAIFGSLPSVSSRHRRLRLAVVADVARQHRVTHLRVEEPVHRRRVGHLLREAQRLRLEVAVDVEARQVEHHRLVARLRRRVEQHQLAARLRRRVEHLPMRDAAADAVVVAERPPQQAAQLQQPPHKHP